MKYNIVTKSPLEIKMGLAQKTNGTLMQYVWGIIIFFVFTDWASSLLGHYYPMKNIDLIINFYKNLNVDTANLSRLAEILPSPAASSGLYMTIIGGVFILGRCIYTLHYLNSLKSEYPLILNGFKFFIKAALLNILMGFFVALWSMLLIVPGIIAFYNYRQAFYILASNPEKSPFQCIKESKFIMNGNKLNLFKLDLSYLLLIIILSLPATIILNFIDTKTLYGLMTFLIFSIPQYIAYASAYLGQAEFFRLLIEPSVKEAYASYDTSYSEGENFINSENSEIIKEDRVYANTKMKIEDLRNVAGTLGIEFDENYTVEELVLLINNELKRGSN